MWFLSYSLVHSAGLLPRYVNTPNEEYKKKKAERLAAKEKAEIDRWRELGYLRDGQWAGIVRAIATSTKPSLWATVDR